MLKIIPVFQEKIWGGNKISKEFNNKDLKGKNIGEAWVVSGFKNNESNIENEELNLNDFYKKNKELFNNYPSEEFPLLIKILDAKQDLSIQVHPNDKEAKELDNYPFGKLESWYILDTKKNNKIIVGTKQKTKEEVSEKIKEGKFLDVVKNHPIKNGDCFEITEGTLHAIKGGTFLYEVQQSSDLTYRFYDYDRLDNDGNKRELHIEKSLKVLKFDENNKIISNQKIIDNLKIDYLVSNKKFSLEKWIVNKKVKLNIKDEKNFLIITCINGKGIVNNVNVKKYDSFIITNNEFNSLNIEGKLELLVSNPN